MRQAREADIWPTLTKKFASLQSEVLLAEGVAFDLSIPCTVIGGRNGTGKSRVLHSLKSSLGERGVLIDLHALCEQALSVIRNQKDGLADLKEEAGSMPLPAERIDDLTRIIGRNYERVDWYGLDIVPGDALIAERFTWSSDPDVTPGTEQTVIPYFEATYRGVDYDSLTMGLGELSTHLLFWILQQYEHAEQLVILIDEPDAYLPPVAASALLSRLLNICKSRANRGWRVILTTHSADIIADALAQNAFVFLEVGQDGGTKATHCADDPQIANVLLARSPVELVIFVEDESAYHLAQALIDGLGARESEPISVVWGRGCAYMVALRQHLPQSRSADIGYVLLFDGDQRTNPRIPVEQAGHWPAVFLPTDTDPDSLFVTVGNNATGISTRLGRRVAEVERFIETLEGKDAHDWVNDLGTQFDRVLVLPALASQWVNENAVATAAFHEELRSAILGARSVIRR